MDKEALATIITQGGRLLTHLLRTYSNPPVKVSLPMLETDLSSERPPEVPIEQPPKSASFFDPVSTEETVLYQRRELAKELILLEGHLQQGCKINSKACDCCEKHPLKIEGLAQETAGMTADPVYSKLADWTRTIAPVTSEEAAASGQYNDEYPKLAMEAREFRKAIMPDMEVKHEQTPGEGVQT